MVRIDTPLSWPLMPCLPVTRIGGDPIYCDDDAGIVGCRADLTVVPVVFVVNLADVGGRSLADLWADGSVRRETYPDVAALARHWQPD